MRGLDHQNRKLAPVLDLLKLRSMFYNMWSMVVGELCIEIRFQRFFEYFIPSETTCIFSLKQAL